MSRREIGDLLRLASRALTEASDVQHTHEARDEYQLASKRVDDLRSRLSAMFDLLEAGPRFPRFLGPAQAAVMGTGWDACAEAVRQSMRGEG